MTPSFPARATMWRRMALEEESIGMMKVNESCWACSDPKEFIVGRAKARVLSSRLWEIRPMPAGRLSLSVGPLGRKVRAVKPLVVVEGENGSKNLQTMKLGDGMGQEKTFKESEDDGL
jgi:hypothetical protein